MAAVPLRAIVIGASAALALAAGGTAAAMPKPGSSGPRAVATAGGDAAAGAWKILKSPRPLVPNGMITAISCRAANACEAVGDSFNGAGAYVTLAEAWNGTAWKLQPSPDPADAADSSVLSGVSCTTADACEAVGSYINRAGATVTLAEAWNGTAWTLQPTPDPAGAESGASLFGVSCGAAGACEAVGDFFRAGDFFTFAEEWNGTSWKLQSTPNPAGATNTALSGVSCSAADACEAVGSNANSAGKGVTLAEAWNGTSWKLQPTPHPAGAKSSNLNGVACGAASACEAVGGSSSGTLAEAWNGTSWKLQPTSNPVGAESSNLNGVSCGAGSACEAVGSYTDRARKQVTLAQRWNGTAWKLQPAPNPAEGASIDLFGVSCTAASACEADGFYSDSAGNDVTVAQGWNGTAWTFQPTPDPAPGAAKSGLSGISCRAAGACEAVGNYRNSLGSSLALAQVWDGTSWKLQSTPLPPRASGDVLLTGVSCSAADACEAVGTYPSKSDSFNDVTLAEAWTGAAWKLQPTPNPANALFSVLLGVSCRAADGCEAVGYSSFGTLAEAWNGTSWKLQPTPNPARTATFVELSGVSCSAANACEAVGFYTNSAGNDVMLAEAWNGTSWKLQPAPDPAGAKNSSLSGVSCSAADACEAVGGSSLGTLAESWNGTSWKLQPAPDPAGAAGSHLSGVSCRAASACEAVGDSRLGTLAEAWNGTAWTLQPAPDPAGSTSSGLSGVSCTVVGACEADGSYTIGKRELTLVMARG